MRNWLFTEEDDDEPSLSEKERQYRKIQLEKTKKQKRSGFIKTVICGPAALSLAITFLHFSDWGLEPALLSLAIAFSISGVAYLLLWKSYDKTIATIEEELDTNKLINSKPNYFRRAAFFYIFTIIIASLLLKYWWPTVFLAMHSSSMSPVIQSLPSTDGRDIKFAIPAAYQRSLNLLPAYNPNHPQTHKTHIPAPYLHITAELPDLKPWNPNWTKLKLLSGTKIRQMRGDAHIPNSYFSAADTNFVGILLTPSFRIAEQDKDIKHTPIRYGLHSLQVPFKYRGVISQQPATIFSSVMHYQPTEAHKYPEMVFICKAACMIAMNYQQEIGLLITFSKTQLHRWSEIIEKVHVLLGSMKKTSD